MPSSVKGYAGKYLRVDMSKGSLTDVAFDEESLGLGHLVDDLKDI